MEKAFKSITSAAGLTSGIESAVFVVMVTGFVLAVSTVSDNNISNLMGAAMMGSGLCVARCMNLLK